MSHWRSRAGIGLAAALLASVLATSFVATALAYTTTNANPSVTAPLGTPTAVGISYVWNGSGPSDTIGPAGTTFAITLPSGYYWTALPTLTPNAGSTFTFSGPVASSGGLTETWTLTGSTLTTPWSLTLAGGAIVATGAAGTGPITLQVGAATPVQIAALTSSYSAGTAVPVTTSPTAVPANGTATIVMTFGTPTVTCTNTASFTVATTGGTFTTTTLPGVTSPVNGTSVTVLCANFGSVAGKTLTLQAPTKAGTATISVTLAGATTPDSAAIVTFTPVSGAPGPSAPGQKGHGARKVAFYATASATTCAATAVVPAAGAKTYGFSVVNTTARNRLNIEVSLKGASPNATYSFWVQQAPGSCSGPYTLRTNGRGNGNRHVNNITLASGATQIWVTASSGSSGFVTSAAAVTAKGHGPKEDNPRSNKDNGKGHGRDDD